LGAVMMAARSGGQVLRLDQARHGVAGQHA
jgi:hypothetical protein